MLLSRFWYIVLSLVVGAAIFLLYIAHAVANRTATRTMDELLAASTKSVEWYLRDHAHQRAAELTELTFNRDVQTALAAANDADSLAEVKDRDKVKSALRSFADKKGFTLVWAIDVNGRVIGSACTLQVCSAYEQATSQADFDMGGYALVHDALHGWVRDDSWVFDDQIYRVVARPVEQKVDDFPIGAIVGATHVNDTFVEAIAKDVGSAVAFFAGGNVAKGVPPDRQAVRSDLEVTADDLKKLLDNKDYAEKGRTKSDTLRTLPKATVGVVFARLPGEAWDLGAGYAVVYRQPRAATPFDYWGLADESDKSAVPTLFIALAAAGASLLGIIFSLLEHTRPLSRFRHAVQELGRGKSDVLKPGSFRGTYKKIASDMNDALDKVAAKSGIERGPADLESVLGPLPAQPQMSAFAVPKGDEFPMKERSLPKAPPKSAPTPPVAPPETGTLPSAGLAPEDRAAVARAMAEPPMAAPHDLATPTPPPAATGDGGSGIKRPLPAPPRRGREDTPAPAPAPAPAAPATGAGPVGTTLGEEPAPAALDGAADGPFDEEADWRRVFDEFMAMKQKLGEPAEKLTYEKFRGTLQRNKDALVARHACQRVQFKVYEKQGKAALKASPVK